MEIMEKKNVMMFGQRNVHQFVFLLCSLSTHYLHITTPVISVQKCLSSIFSSPSLWLLFGLFNIHGMKLFIASLPVVTRIYRIIYSDIVCGIKIYIFPFSFSFEIRKIHNLLFVYFYYFNAELIFIDLLCNMNKK